MTARERVIGAILRKDTDFVPHQLDVTKDTDERLAEYFGDKNYLYSIANNHLVREKNKNHKMIDDSSYSDLFASISFVRSGMI